MSMTLVDVVDADDRVLRQVTRAEMRRENLLHRAVYLLVFNGRGEILIHRRTTGKDIYPGYFDVTVGGVVDAGEDYDTAARRELAEEVGIDGVAVERLFDVRYADASTQLIGRAFLVRHDGPIRLQAEEVAWAAFVPLAEAERVMRAERCCPDGAQVLRRHLAGSTSTSSPMGIRSASRRRTPPGDRRARRTRRAMRWQPALRRGAPALRTSRWRAAASSCRRARSSSIR